jgi:hypothetical protein
MKLGISNKAWFAALLVLLCACASIVATQSFEITTEVAMPDIPNVDLPEGVDAPPQTLRLRASFGSCSRTALGSLDKLRENANVKSADVWVVVRDIQLRSDSSFSGIEELDISLVTPDETLNICNRRLSESDQAGSTIDCGFEHRMRAEQLCSTLSGDGSGTASMTIELSVQTGDVTLTTLSASIQVDTDLEVDVGI